MNTKKAVDKFKEAIELHKNRGIETYVLTCESGQKCLIRQPSVVETAKIMPIMQGMGFDANGNPNEPDMLGAGKRLIQMCWIAGDNQIKKDENLMAEVAMSAVTLIEVKIAKVKKN